MAKKPLFSCFCTSLYLLAICELHGMTFLCRCALRFHSIVDEMAKIALKTGVYYYVPNCFITVLNYNPCQGYMVVKHFTYITMYKKLQWYLTSRLFEMMWYEGILKTIPVMILPNWSSNFSLHHLVWRHTLLQRSQHQGWLLAMGRAPQGVGRLWVKMCCLKACNLHWYLVQKSWSHLSVYRPGTTPRRWKTYTVSKRFLCASGGQLLLPIVSVPWNLVITTSFGLYVAFRFMCCKVTLLFSIFIIQTWIYLLWNV